LFLRHFGLSDEGSEGQKVKASGVDVDAGAAAMLESG
jgi:hypothetical protein